MISVDMNGAIYEGRLMHISAHEQIFTSPEGVTTYKNYAYDVELMDAFGARIHLFIDSLEQIKVM